MSFLSVTESARMARVSVQSVQEKLDSGELSLTSTGIDVQELIKLYPDLKPLANVKLRKIKSESVLGQHEEQGENGLLSQADIVLEESNDTAVDEQQKVALLIRELEWNKQLLEQTNQNMAQQLAKQQAMIADQARRLDEKDRFWARQVEIAQSLLPAPAPQKRKNYLAFSK